MVIYTNLRKFKKGTAMSSFKGYTWGFDLAEMQLKSKKAKALNFYFVFVFIMYSVNTFG